MDEYGVPLAHKFGAEAGRGHHLQHIRQRHNTLRDSGGAGPGGTPCVRPKRSAIEARRSERERERAPGTGGAGGGRRRSVGTCPTCSSHCVSDSLWSHDGSLPSASLRHRPCNLPRLFFITWMFSMSAAVNRSLPVTQPNDRWLCSHCGSSGRSRGLAGGWVGACKVQARVPVVLRVLAAAAMGFVCRRVDLGPAVCRRGHGASPSPGADVAWGKPSPGAGVGRGEPSHVAGVAAASAVPLQMRVGRAQSRSSLQRLACTINRRSPAPSEPRPLERLHGDRSIGGRETAGKGLGTRRGAASADAARGGARPRRERSGRRHAAWTSSVGGGTDDEEGAAAGVGLVHQRQQQLIFRRAVPLHACRRVREGTLTASLTHSLARRRVARPPKRNSIAP